MPGRAPPSTSAAASAERALARTEAAPARLVEMSEDVRAAVLLDPAGGLIAASDGDTDRAPEARRSSPTS